MIHIKPIGSGQTLPTALSAVPYTKKGRWIWAEHPAEGAKIKCPACQRTQDANPAGYLTIHGGFYQSHNKEIDGLIEHILNREKKEHPLKRMMGRIKNPDGSWLYTFTEPHLAVQVGDQLKRAYDGTPDFHIRGSRI